MKRFISLIIAAMLILCGCSLKEDGDALPTPGVPSAQSPAAAPGDKVIARIDVKDYGTIELELYPDIAPETVRNFVSLARQGFYDGLTFHRVIEGFMIQGGCPYGDGTGGPGYCIKGEFDDNGFENDLSHVRGVISMARQLENMDSAGSQFFIVHQDSTSLDGGYAAFGRVTDGMDVVDAIAAADVNALTDKPYEPVVISSITIDGPELPEPSKIK